MGADNVQRYYDANPQLEWDRLGVRNRTEYAVTMRALGEYLPPPPATILDVGGGPGRYSIELSRRGYDVTLVDLAQANVEFARERASEAGVALAGSGQADARDLSGFSDASFDAVLLMGPLYHLLDESDRRTSVSEALRVLRPLGRVFASFITRYAPLRFWAKLNPSFVLDNREAFEEMFATGRAPAVPGFTDLYLESPQSIIPFMERAGAQTLGLIGCEGVISQIRDRVEDLVDDAWEFWVDINYRLGRDPSTHGIAEHLLYIGAAPG